VCSVPYLGHFTAADLEPDAAAGSDSGNWKPRGERCWPVTGKKLHVTSQPGSNVKEPPQSRGKCRWQHLRYHLVRRFVRNALDDEINRAIAEAIDSGRP
jgi:hypothetical protein